MLHNEGVLLFTSTQMGSGTGWEFLVAIINQTMGHSMRKMCFCEFTRHKLLLMPILVKNLPNLNQPKTSYLHFPADVLQPAVSYSWLWNTFQKFVLKSFNLTLLFCLSFISYWFRCGALERSIGYYCDQTNKSNENLVHLEPETLQTWGESVLAYAGPWHSCEQSTAYLLINPLTYIFD